MEAAGLGWSMAGCGSYAELCIATKPSHSRALVQLRIAAIRREGLSVLYARVAAVSLIKFSCHPRNSWANRR